MRKELEVRIRDLTAVDMILLAAAFGYGRGADLDEKIFIWRSVGRVIARHGSDWRAQDLRDRVILRKDWINTQ